MKICVLNGSPRGVDSITLKYVEFLEASSDKDIFTYHHVAKNYKAYEISDDELLILIDDIIKSDLVICAFPVYNFLAPYQLMRFFEVLRDHRIGPRIANIHFTWITSSNKIGDSFAHKYMRQLATEMGMRVLDGYSVSSKDMYEAENRKSLLDFWGLVHSMADNNIGGSYPIKVPYRMPYTYFPDFKLIDTPKSDSFDTVIITDVTDENAGLRNLINSFKAFYPNRTREININRFTFENGCIGCMNCIKGDDCPIEDGFIDFYNNEIEKADAIVFAASMKNAYIMPLWKCYEDRLFTKGLENLPNKAFAYIISHCNSSTDNIRDVFSAKHDLFGNYNVGFVTDDSKDASIIGDMLQLLAKELDYVLQNRLEPSEKFFGKGLTALIRDYIYANRSYLKHQHKFAKQHGLYEDLPSRQTSQAQSWRHGLMNRMSKDNKYGYEHKLLHKDFSKLVDRKRANKL